MTITRGKRNEMRCDGTVRRWHVCACVCALVSYIKIHQLKIMKTFRSRRQFNWFLNAKLLRLGHVNAFCVCQMPLEATFSVRKIVVGISFENARIRLKPTIEWSNNPIYCIVFETFAFVRCWRVENATTTYAHRTRHHRHRRHTLI